jgi:hypothetical protein
MEADTFDTAVRSPRLLRAKSIAVMRIRLSLMAMKCPQVGLSGQLSFHVSTKAGDNLRAFSAPAMYAAGAILTADVRPNPPRDSGICSC